MKIGRQKLFSFLSAGWTIQNIGEGGITLVRRGKIVEGTLTDRQVKDLAQVFVQQGVYV